MFNHSLLLVTLTGNLSWLYNSLTRRVWLSVFRVFMIRTIAASICNTIATLFLSARCQAWQPVSGEWREMGSKMKIEKLERGRVKSERTRSPSLSPYPGLKVFSPAHFSFGCGRNAMGARGGRFPSLLPRAPLAPKIHFPFSFACLSRRLLNAWKRLKVWKRGF